MNFAEILEAVDELPIEDKIEMSRLIQLRLDSEKREILNNEVQEADYELKNGKLRIQSIDNIMDDILNEL